MNGESTTFARPNGHIPTSALDRIDDSLRRSQDWFWSRQQPGGFWHAPLEANVSMDAEYVFFNRFMDRRPALEKRVVEHILATQQDDGSWPLYHGGPGHLSDTIEAYFALKLAGHSADEAPLRKAREFIRANGGLEKAGVFTRTFLSYFGQFPAWALPAMPVEVVLLPPWFPINIYALSSWARGTVVPLTLIMAKQPRIAIDANMGVEELWVNQPTPELLGYPRSKSLVTWRNFFLAVDRTLKILGRSSWKPLRRRATKRAEEWVLSHQDWNGGWGGIQPAMINSVMALRALGYADDHPAVAKGLQGIDDFVAEHEGQVFYQPCVSPTWDTALALKGMLDAGVDPAHPGMVKAAEWLIANQIFKPGDWSIYNPDLEPGGWAFEFANDWYPDVDDSAVILMALKKIATPDVKARDRSIAYGLNWTMGMQSRCGGYGAFDTDNDSEFLNQIPFADMEAMIDPPAEDLTGRLLELMGTYGYDLSFNRARRAHQWLLKMQRPDGSWWGRWGVNFIYGTWSVLCGLRAIGDDLDAPHVRRAVAWLESKQNADGGWGETLNSYADESDAGRGVSTPSQTAWAILGLLAGRRDVSPAVFKGMAYLVENQRADGGWDEDEFTGTGFPRHFYLRYYWYRHYFPLAALGQAKERIGDAARSL